MDSYIYTNKFIFEKQNKKLLNRKIVLNAVFICLFAVMISGLVAFLCVYGIRKKLNTVLIINSISSILLLGLISIFSILEIIRTNKICNQLKKLDVYIKEYNNSICLTSQNINRLTYAFIAISAVMFGVAIFSFILFFKNTANIEKLFVSILTFYLSILCLYFFMFNLLNDKFNYQQYCIQNKKASK